MSIGMWKSEFFFYITCNENVSSNSVSSRPLLGNSISLDLRVLFELCKKWEKKYIFKKSILTSELVRNREYNTLGSKWLAWYTSLQRTNVFEFSFSLLRNFFFFKKNFDFSLWGKHCYFSKLHVLFIFFLSQWGGSEVQGPRDFQ